MAAATDTANVVAALRAKPPLQKFVYAIKLGSWPKLFAPTLLGQAIGIAESKGFSLAGFLLGVLFTTLDIVYVVLLNDWGDRDVDAIKRRLFPEGCSPKTIPDGILPAATLLALGLGSGALLLTCAAFLGPKLGRPLFLPLAAASLLLFAIYTFKPVALNYRGGGEFLEMFGVGLLLPWLNVYLQSGLRTPADAPTFVMLAPGLASLALSSALASGLSDEESDREGGKRTFTTLFGNTKTRSWVIRSYGFGALALAAGWLWTSRQSALWLSPALAALLGFWSPLRKAGPLATTNAFKAQNVFKEKLHLGLWGGQVLLGTSLIVKTLVSVIW